MLIAVLGAIVVGGAPSASAAAPRPADSLKSAAPGVQAPFHLSCPSRSLCVGVDSAGHAMVSTDPTGTGAVWQIADIDGSRRLDAISCPSTTLCVAVDDAGDVVTSNRPTAGAGAWRVTNIEGSTALNDVSCSATNLCVAVGGRDVAASTQPAAGAPWPVLLDADQTVGPECGKYAAGQGCTATLATVTCTSASFCAALDNWGQVISFPTLRPAA